MGPQIAPKPANRDAKFETALKPTFFVIFDQKFFAKEKLYFEMSHSPKNLGKWSKGTIL